MQKGKVGICEDNVTHLGGRRGRREECRRDEWGSTSLDAKFEIRAEECEKSNKSR